MYDPRKRPFVSHTRGTELVIEHIESKWCPSILGEDLTHVDADTARLTPVGQPILAAAAFQAARRVNV